MKYFNKNTGDIKVVNFPWFWILTPLCSLDLLMKGKIFHALVGWIPFFTIVWLFKWKKIIGSSLEKKGYVLQN